MLLIAGGAQERAVCANRFWRRDADKERRREALCEQARQARRRRADIENRPKLPVNRGKALRNIPGCAREEEILAPRGKRPCEPAAGEAPVEDLRDKGHSRVLWRDGSERHARP